MRCLCLFLGPVRPSHRVIPKHATPSYSVGVPSSVSPPRWRRPKSLVNDDVSTSQQQVGELGHTLLATLQTNPVVPIPKSQQQRKKEGEEAQISGSDVLWALQRASARKNKKKNKKQEQKRVSSSVATPREESAIAVDYTNVRPLCINPNWAAKLDELDKRLRELSDAI